MTSCKISDLYLLLKPSFEFDPYMHSDDVTRALPEVSRSADNVFLKAYT